MGRTLRRAAARSFALLPPLLLAGCLEFDLASAISWSPKGDAVAFVSGGRAWTHALATGETRPLRTARPPSALAWSPDGAVVAAAGAGRVELVDAASGAAGRSYELPVESTSTPVFLWWHPSGRRLLAAELRDDDARTSEIDLSSPSARALGDGLAAYGPGGEWLLWIAAARFGTRERLVFDRQSASGEALPLPAGTAEALEAAELDSTLDALADGGERPLCARRKGGEPSELLCLDASARVARVARVPGRARVFPDPARRRFALLEEREKERPRLTVADAKGRALADGTRLVEAALGPFGPDGKPARSRVGRMAWSPGSERIAWVAGGRLCLWDWAKDEVRVVEPPGR